MTQVQGQGAGRKQRTHGLLMGYALWILGFFGAHRFYYGRRVSGTIWFFTLGLLGIGWLIYLGKVGTGLLYLLTGGLLGAGVLYDYLSFNEQVSIANGQWRD